MSDTTLARKRHSSDMVAYKRKSLRLQHSMSLHIPIEELDKTNCGINCFVEMPQQVFSLTFLEANETYNPQTLEALEELKGNHWQTYLVGYLYNFNYKESQISSLVKALNNAFTANFQDRTTGYFESRVSQVEELSPTENDSPALIIQVWVKRSAMGENEEEEGEQLLYEGYLMSWCNSIRAANTLLPVLLCQGKKMYKNVVHSVLSERFSVNIKQFVLSQEDFMHLSTYCIIMLDNNDNIPVTYAYKTPLGIFKINVNVEYLLTLWNKIHKDDSIDVELDEVLLFHDALEFFFEATFGIKLGRTHFANISAKSCFSLGTNLTFWSKSTKIIHVILKYITYLAIQKLKVKSLDETSVSVN